MPTAPGDGRPEARGLARPRLLACLDEGADLTLVLAPAGSGKTTLLAQFAATAEVPRAWHRAGSADMEEACLARQLCNALHMAGLTESPNDSGGTLAGLAQRICRRWPADAAPALLLLDDFHVIIDTPAAAAFEAFLARRPAALRVVVASRRQPAFNLSCAELGTVTVISADDLRFRTWEVEQLFGDVYREPLPPTEAAALARRTEGWAAGLHLFHLSTHGRRLDERRDAIDALSGRSRYARGYLARTVLDDLPSGLRDFLRRTCVFEVLTAERCDRLLGIDDAQRRLEDLERRQALTTSDDDGRSFRYHEVLRRHLESSLVEELGATGARAWYAEAAALLEAERAIPEAVRGFALAERWLDARRLLPQPGLEAVDGNGGTTWCNLFPAELIDEDPWLSLSVARRLTREGSLDAASRRFKQAEQLFTDRPGCEVAAAERRIVEVWTGALAQPHLHWLDAVRTALRSHPETTASEYDGPNAALVRALALLVAGEAPAALTVLHQQVAAPAGACALGARLAAAVAALIATDSPQLDNLDRLSTDADRDGFAWIARQARALGPAAVLHMGGAPDTGAVATVAAECDRTGDTWGALLAYGVHALIRLLTGQVSAADWADVARRATAVDAASLEAWAAAFGALAAAREGFNDDRAQARAHRLVRAAGVRRAQDVVDLASDDASSAGAPAWVSRLAVAVPVLEAPVFPAPQARAPDSSRSAGAKRPYSPAMTVRCYGGFQILCDEQDLDWSELRPRAAATMRLLAINAGRQVNREALLDALWPGVPVAQAKRNLQVAVSSLRRFLEPAVPRGAAAIVVRVGDTYAFVPPEGSDVDVVAFRTGLEGARRARLARDAVAERAGLARAVAAYSGDLLPADGPAEWVVGERERSRVQAATAACDLAVAEAATGAFDAAVAASRRSLEIDPFRDASWRTLIAAYRRLGDTAEAEHARQEYESVLATLGVSGR